MDKYYINLVMLYNITHTYHINTLWMNFLIHSYLWELYEALQEKVDDIGEQIVVLWGKVPTLSKIMKETNLTEIEDVDNALEYVHDLYDANEWIKALLLKATSDSKIDEWTRNLLADALLFHWKVCKKLTSLM